MRSVLSPHITGAALILGGLVLARKFANESEGRSRSEPGSRNLDVQFAGNVVLVTGARQGIGRAMALKIAAAGFPNGLANSSGLVGRNAET